MNIEKKIHRRVGEAIRRFRLIEEGDHILVGISGGKDSMSLAKVLREKQTYFPLKFKVTAAHVVMDIFPRDDALISRIDNAFTDLDIPLERRFVSVKNRLDAGERVNCFFCAMHRRMAMIRMAKALGCKKIAYGHHMDDVIETLLMNMFYKGEISTMPARLELDNHDIVIVRPLVLAKEREVSTYAARCGLSDIDGPACPHGEDGRRVRIKRLITELSREHSGIRNNLFAALGRVKIDYLLEKRKGT